MRSNAGRSLAVAALAVVVLAAGWTVWRTFAGSEAEAAARDRAFICAETGKPFEHELTAGETYPVKSPHSGKETGYPAELCYWAKDGTVKSKPTAVLLNEYKGARAPTFCPDCGRLVVGHNPHPQPGATPPPTQQEYAARRGDGAARRAPRGPE